MITAVVKFITPIRDNPEIFYIFVFLSKALSFLIFNNTYLWKL